MSFEITANHAHVFPKNVREDGTVDNLLHYMDDLNVSRSVCFATLPRFLGPEDEETNTWLYKELKGKDRLVGFGAIDFEKGDLRGQVNRISDYGFKGIKIHPALQHICVDGEKAFEVYEQAEKNGLFITFHTGVHWSRVSDYQPWRFDEVAYHFPKLAFSMEHIGGYCYFNETMAVLINNARPGQAPRVYGGFTTIFFHEGKHKLWYLSEQQRHDVIWLLGAEYVIYGMDYPYNRMEENKMAIESILNMDISDEEKQLILGGNLKRALDI